MPAATLPAEDHQAGEECPQQPRSWMHVIRAPTAMRLSPRASQNAKLKTRSRYARRLQQPPTLRRRLPAWSCLGRQDVGPGCLESSGGMDGGGGRRREPESGDGGVWERHSGTEGRARTCEVVAAASCSGIFLIIKEAKAICVLLILIGVGVPCNNIMTSSAKYLCLHRFPESRRQRGRNCFVGS